MAKDGEIVKKISRRKLLYWMIPVVGSSAIVLLFRSVYSRSIENLAKIFRGRRRNTKYDLVWNKRTNIVQYYPESYKQDQEDRFERIAFDSWKSELAHPKRLNKGKSGVILEDLALSEISIPVADEGLDNATKVLARAFSTEYTNINGYQMNCRNWRLYHLLLQLIALNTSIDSESKWTTFTDIVHLEDLIKKRISIPKQNNWITLEGKFNQRVDYIIKNSHIYRQRLERRVA